MKTMQPDVKDIMIDGCQVHLDFHSLTDGRWGVGVTIQSGVGTNTTKQSFQTGPCATHESAEHESLRIVIDHLGKNIDCSTSRVKNRS